MPKRKTRAYTTVSKRVRISEEKAISLKSEEKPNPQPVYR